MYRSLASISPSSCPSLLRAGIVGMCHYARFIVILIFENKFLYLGLLDQHKIIPRGLGMDL